MISIKTPSKRGFFQVYDFGSIAFNFPNAVSCTTTSSSTTVVGDTTGLVAGLSVTGTNIPANTVISSITDSTHFVISNAASASGSTSLSFTLSSRIIDEIILCDQSNIDANQVIFVKRYNTWLIYTNLQNGNFVYNIVFMHYDRTNQVAYTATNKIQFFTAA